MAKRLLLLSALAVSVAAQQQQQETVTVPKSMLNQQQLADLEREQTKQKIQDYGEWVGVGKEIGVAVDSSLSAISNRANEFANTKVGTVTMWVVVWKVLGRDIVGYIFGFGLLGIGIPVILWSYRKRVLPSQILKKEYFDEKGKRVREYATYEPPTYRDVPMGLSHFTAFLILCIPALFSIFG
jgi:hypothetical protein